MLTEQKLLELCEQHQLSDTAIAVINNVRNSDPSRNPQSGTHNNVTRYSSHKMGLVVKAEADSTELAAAYVWDHDRETYEFYDQPPQIKKIRIDPTGRQTATRYTPDFFRISQDFIGWVECKEERWLQKQLESDRSDFVFEGGVWRCPPAERYAQSVGLGFCVRPSFPDEKTLIQNIADLSDFYRKDCPQVSLEDCAKAQSLLEPTGWAWLRDLLQPETGISPDTVFKLIADEVLHVDLGQFLLMSEAHRVRVFRNKVLMDSANLWLPALTAPTLPSSLQVCLSPGTSISWDGVPYEIVNVGASSVFLKTNDIPMLDIPTTTFRELVASGSISGATEVADPRLGAIAEILRHANAEDHKLALEKMACLYPDRFPDVKYVKRTDRTERIWRAQAKRGLDEYGNEFLGLLPKVRLRGNRQRRLEDMALEHMHDVIEHEVMNGAKIGSFAAWSILNARCTAEGLIPPSRRTFEEEVRRLKSPEQLKRAREGDKAAYALEVPYLSLDRETPKHGTRAFAKAHIDHTELDLQFVDESFGRNMKKAWLTVMIDAFTRTILAWVVLFDPPSYRSCMLLIRDCVRRHQRVPKIIITDQGSDFKSKYFDLLIAYMDSHKTLRPAGKPRSGSIIERFFGLNNTAFIHALRGNNQALQSPRSMSATHDPMRLAVWNLRAFHEAFERFLNEVYHTVEHPALGVSPNKAMEVSMTTTGYRTHTLVPYTRQFVIETMPSTKKGSAKVQTNSSVTINRVEYFSPRLGTFVGNQCEDRYDPFDLSRAYVLCGHDWIEVTSGYASILAGRTEKEIAIISSEFNELNSREGIREKDRALQLGIFIESLRDKESSLALETQIARDREQEATYKGTGFHVPPPEQDEDGSDCSSSDANTNVVPIKPPRSRAASTKQMRHDVFETGQRQVFGDFE